MVIDYLLPKLSMSMNEGTLSWMVSHGDKIEKGQAILELETDKAVQEVEAPAAGYLCITAPEGETRKVETVIGHIFSSQDEFNTFENGGVVATQPSTEEKSSADPEAVTKTTGASDNVSGAKSRIIASPLAKRIAADNQVDLSKLEGTGPSGRIIKQDVLAAMEKATVALENKVQTNSGGLVERERVPMKGMRKAIANNMMDSLQNSAQLSSIWESDITDLSKVRKKFVAREEQFGTKVSMNALIIKAISYAINQVPIANSCLVDDEIVIYESVNVGIAVSVPGSTEYDTGLLVPVLRDVGRMGVVEIDKAFKELIAKLRANELTAEDFEGATITMTSTAGLAPPGCQSTPILNRPNAVIVNPSTAIDKPAVHEGNIVPRTMIPMAITFDHCMLDGSLAVKFANAIHEGLENPELLLS